MAVYHVEVEGAVIDVTLTANQDDAMAVIAVKAEKTTQQILEQLYAMPLSQIMQWISEEAKSQIESMDAAEALSKLKK